MFRVLFRLDGEESQRTLERSQVPNSVFGLVKNAEKSKNQQILAVSRHARSRAARLCSGVAGRACRIVRGISSEQT
jgi:hypothetical protein